MLFLRHNVRIDPDGSASHEVSSLLFSGSLAMSGRPFPHRCVLYVRRNRQLCMRCEAKSIRVTSDPLLHFHHPPLTHSICTVPRRHASTVQSPNRMRDCLFLPVIYGDVMLNHCAFRDIMPWLWEHPRHPTASHSKCEMKITTKRIGSSLHLGK